MRSKYECNLLAEVGVPHRLQKQNSIDSPSAFPVVLIKSGMRDSLNKLVLALGIRTS
jgi:hypothetical protein